MGGKGSGGKPHYKVSIDPLIKEIWHHIQVIHKGSKREFFARAGIAWSSFYYLLRKRYSPRLTTLRAITDELELDIILVPKDKDPVILKWPKKRKCAIR